jgi:iron complex outermembrane receptor protein
MTKLSPLYHAVICALTAGAAPLVYAQEEPAPAKEKKIETIMVTATKRTQNIQETPLAVQAVSAESIIDLNIGNFDDFVRYMPNVTSAGRGPGQSDVFIRGMAIQPIAVMLSGAQGTMPNVALYVDEQPVTAPGRNLDVYATDLERIEVLPGPQGTLFGASSQAGTIRYITQKPQLDGVSARVSGTTSNTKGGEMSQTVEGFVNLPLSDDLAVRMAFYNVHRGGYIDNVFGEFTLDPAINSQSNVDLGPGTIYDSVNNGALVEEDFNDSFYKGFRLGAKYLINDDWTLLAQHAQQELGADGVFDYDPEVGDLQVSRFFPDKLNDKFNLTSWTVEGRMNELDIVYTGAFLDREVNQSIDYTGYNNSGAFIPWYTCTYEETRHCLHADKGFKGKQDHTRLTQELRLSTEFGDKWHVIGGVFYDDVKIETQDDYFYMAAPELGFAPNAPVSTADNINNNTRVPGVAFFNDITRTEKQLALFGEVSYDLTEQLTATVGLRYYDMESDFYGSSNFAEKGTDGDSGRDYDVTGGHTDEPLKADDTITKYNLSYQANDDWLLYGTLSEGFRPGGFNRGGGADSINPDFPGVKVTYDTDDVTNYEFGWKSMLLDHSLRFNGSVYFIEWDSMQVSRFDPQNVSILTFVENSADAEIFGVEFDTSWIVGDHLTLFSAVSYNDTELTAVNAQVIEMAPIGSELPMSPKVQGNIRARYDFEVGRYMGNWQVGVQYAGKSYSSIVAAERQTQDSYTMANASVTIEDDAWRVTLFVDNLTDKRPELFINNQDDITRIATSRPRSIGLTVSFSYE